MSSDDTAWTSMNNAARISYPGGGLIFPTDSAQDWKVICELVQGYGEVQLAINGVVVRVQQPSGQRTGSCMRCGYRLRHLMCVLDARALCLRCVKTIARGSQPAACQ